MRLEIHVHFHPDPSLASVLEKSVQALDSINHKAGQIMSKLSQLENRLATVDAALTKIGGETSTLVQEVADLRSQLQDVDLPAGAEEKLASIESRVKTIDDAVPDPEAPPTDGGGETSNG